MKDLQEDLSEILVQWILFLIEATTELVLHLIIWVCAILSVVPCAYRCFRRILAAIR